MYDASVRYRGFEPSVLVIDSDFMSARSQFYEEQNRVSMIQKGRINDIINTVSGLNSVHHGLIQINSEVDMLGGSSVQ